MSPSRPRHPRSVSAQPERRPFCPDKLAAEAFDRWRTRLAALGLELSDGDLYVLGVAASREARLESLAIDLKREKDAGRRLKLVAAERLAAADMTRVLDLLGRTYGTAVADPVPEVEEATGTEGETRVLPFSSAATHGLGPTAARIVAALQRAGRPLTKGALRRRVPGNQGHFLDGLKEAERAGAIVRGGVGRKGKPFTFEMRS
jgi:hypothetical protein